jgi:hypothetical protein
MQGIHLNNSVFVIPAFELVDDVSPPSNKKELKDLLKKGLIKPAHIGFTTQYIAFLTLRIEKTFHSHGPTDHYRWYYATDIYPVDYDLFFEPYMIINTTTTPK